VSTETYGRYQLLKKLATGGMAQIYLARQLGMEGFEKLVVVKRILPHLAENEEFIGMFLQEARIAARLSHPNVVQIYDLGAQDDSYFIAMEYIHGEDVRRVWKRAEELGTPIPVPLICRVIIEACAGLDYAHKRADQQGRPLNIVHRDVSPQNILVSFEGHVKIVDFGIAKAADQATVTRSGVLKGKYSYMSPEQAGGQPVDCRTDVFALGVVMYELLTGARLFKRANDILTLNAVTECRIEPPSRVNPALPPALDEILMRALAKEPEDRFAEARQLAAALEAWLLAEKLPSSSAHLAEFMTSLYADRLAREAEEGRLLFTDAGEASRREEVERATPASNQSGRPTRSMRATGPRSEASVQAAVARASTRSSQARSKPALPPVKEPSPAPARPTQSLSTREPRPPRTIWPWLLGAGALLGGLGGAWVFSRPAPGLVTITTQPEGAHLELEGAVLPCVTPCALPERAAGRYALKITLPGRQPIDTQLAIAPGEQTRSFALEPLAPAPVDAGAQAPLALQVTSTPPGAQVFVDGVDRGRTPLVLEALAGTALDLRLELDGYVTAITHVVADRQALEQHLELSPMKPLTPRPLKHELPPVVALPVDQRPVGTGTVRFVVKPWATVECGSHKFGDTPFPDQTLPAGELRCTFSNPELGQQVKVVKVEPNALTKVAVTFGDGN
jgi:serine/threonine-protein kinase